MVLRYRVTQKEDIIVWLAAYTESFFGLGAISGDQRRCMVTLVSHCHQRWAPQEVFVP